jgi:hypothetical protein
MMSACQLLHSRQTPIAIDAEAVCAAWLKIYVSHADVLTVGTQAQIEDNNAAHAVACRY